MSGLGLQEERRHHRLYSYLNFELIPKALLPELPNPEALQSQTASILDRNLRPELGAPLRWTWQTPWCGPRGSLELSAVGGV